MPTLIDRWLRYWPIWVMAILTFFVQIPDFYGEDIVNARNNFLTGAKYDFWGGSSTLVYGHVPNFGLRWQIWLAIIQIIFTSVGLLRFLKTNIIRPRLVAINLIVIYSALIFGSQMTRDGLMFSLLVLGFGILKTKTEKRITFLELPVPMLIIVFALSFRPWVAIAILPLLYFMIHNSQVGWAARIGISVLVVVIPVGLDFGVTKALELKRSFPEQQVMALDAAATFCYTNNLHTGKKAEKALGAFSKDPNFVKSVCQLFRPDTWVSMTRSSQASSQGIKPSFTLISPEERQKYESLKSTWAEMIISDPVTYLQNKTLFMGKLLIGSDSRNFSLNTADTFLAKTRSFYKLPFEIAIIFHLYSIAACIFWVLLLPIFNYLKNREKDFTVGRLSISLLSSLWIWSILSSIAYIGSNGRYTYSITILALIMFLSHLNSIRAQVGKNE